VTKSQLSKLAALLARISRACAARGKKTELARVLGKPPQRVNDWLTGIVAPGGEVTLLMLEWVTAEEANQQKESRGSGVAPPRPKARKRKSSYEKPRSSPRK
jgi:DNA-binding transcriptional regulator YdaS (Cro superfamily)